MLNKIYFFDDFWEYMESFVLKHKRSLEVHVNRDFKFAMIKIGRARCEKQ